MKNYFLQASVGFLLLIPLYVSADTVSTSTNEGTTTVDSSFVTDVSTSTEKNFTTCSQDAIEKRDTSIASSRALYNIAMTNALKERKNKEKAAVAITNDNKKKDAIKLSVTTYKNLVKVAQSSITDAREQAWKDFENDIATCHDIEDKGIASKKEARKEMGVESDTLLMKKGEITEPKTIQETIKEQISAFRSLFN